MFTKKTENEAGKIEDSASRPVPAPSPGIVTKQAAITPASETPKSTPKVTKGGTSVPSLIGSDLVVTGNINSKGEVQVEDIE